MRLFNFLKQKATREAPPETLEDTLARARSVSQQGQHADALAICTEILTRQPDHLGTLCLSADIAAKSGNSDRALQTYRKVLDLQPDDAVAHYKCGNILKDREQMDAALASYDAAIALHAGYAHAFCNRGVVLERLTRWDEALQSYDTAISVAPGDALAHYNRAGVLRKLARHEEALASYAQAIAVQPDYFEAHCNRGFLLIEMNRWDEALASHMKCIEISPCFAPGHFGRGLVHQERKEGDAALASFDRAIECDPGHASAHFRRGCLLMESRQWNAARSSLDQATRLKPDFAEAYYSLAVVWTTVGQSEVGLANFDRAIALKPDYAEAYLSRGTLLIEMRRFLPAIESFERGVALNGDSSFVLGARCFAKMSMCDWSDHAADLSRLTAGIESGEKVSPPHQALVLLDSPRLHFEAARLWVQQVHHPNPGLPALSRRRQKEKIRIGYFSGEFYQHPVSVLMAGVFEGHDRARHEVTAFSYGPHSQDAFGMRLQRGFDRFVDVRERSDRDLALLAREMEIDIAVDLAGLTGRSRIGIFAWRAAPVQVNYLGYAGTMGAEFMDYLIADETVVPEGHESYYAEKTVRLPHGFFPHDPCQAIAETIYTREELGLPLSGFVFCCFNNAYKINPEVFDSWMRILARVPNSVLWLSQSNESMVDNLRRESLRRGVDADRLIFASHMPSPAEHLARQRAADLFLDTRPYNAHSTAIDALWAGLPVLTLPGSGFAARVAASLLNAAQLPELIATSVGSYEDMAVNLAENPRYLAAMKETLARKRLESPLFDTPRFVKHLETGYARMLERFDAGLPPEHFRVQA